MHRKNREPQRRMEPVLFVKLRKEGPGLWLRPTLSYQSLPPTSLTCGWEVQEARGYLSQITQVRESVQLSVTKG